MASQYVSRIAIHLSRYVIRIAIRRSRYNTRIAGPCIAMHRYDPIYQRVQSFVGSNITHATPRDTSVGSRDSRDSSFKFQYATVIKLLIRWLPVKLSHFPFTHSLLIFLGDYLPKNNYEKCQTGWVRILQKCHSVYPPLPVSFKGDTKSRQSLLLGVYARGSKRSHHWNV